MANVKGGGDGPSTASSGWSNNANAGNVTSALNTMQAGNYNTSDTQEWNQETGGMSVAQFQALPQAEQQKITTQVQDTTDARAYAPSLFDQILGKVALMGTVGALTAGIGGELAPLASQAVGGAASPIASSIASGATYGAVGGTLNSAFTGQNIGKGLLTGAVMGGIGGGISGALSGDGLSSGANNLIGKAATGAAAAPVNSLINGGQPQQSGANTSGSAPMTGSNPGLTYNSGASAPSSGARQMGPNPLGVLGAAGAVGAGATMSNSSMGTNGNMASTDSSLASTITGALPGVLQAGSTIGGAVAAGNALQNANQNSITTQQNNLGNINNIWSTQQQTGQGANTALQSSLGLNGQTANPSNFLNMPGYQFAVQQGTQATQRQAAAMGSAYTPNTAAAIGQYVTGTASQDYNTYISQLMGAAGLGTTANQGLQTANQTTANNISQNQMNIGAAQAGEYTGVAGATSGLFSPNGAGTGLIGAAGNYLNGSGVSPMNYGGSNPNGTVGNGTSSDPYGANASQYNMTNTGNTSVDPSTGQPWTSGATTTPTFDSSGITDPSIGMDLSGDTAWNSVTDAGSTAGSDVSNFLGDW
jgi:predicted NAD-dependent protein-ADP-ribosyltransferase YbiA (DUF1768 family)